MIVMGAIYKDDCPSEPYIPIYHLVNGVIHCVSVLLLLLRSQLEKVCIGPDYFIIMFSFIWFVAGSSYVFKNLNEEEHCDLNFLNFTLGILIVDYVIYGVGFMIWWFGFRIRAFFYERLE